MSTVPLRYKFTLPNSSEQEVVLELDKDTALSVEILSHVTGQKPLGYRAPLGSIGDQFAVNRNDLHIGRAIRHGPVGDARQFGAVPGDQAGQTDAGP